MRITFLFLLCFGVQAAELRIDHVTVCGTDVKQMQAALMAVGIASEYGGPHSNHATEMALTSFPDGSYLEQIAIQSKGEATAIDKHEWSKQMKGNAGPCAWAVRPDDMAAEVTRLKARIQVTNPEKAGRSRPDGVRLDWETSQVGPMARGTFFPFLIRDFTPRQARAQPSGKPATLEFEGVTKVVIGVRDLNGAIAQYRKAYELGNVRTLTNPEFGAKLSWFVGTPVVLATPLDGDSWLAKRLGQFGDGPCAIVLKKELKRPETGSAWFGGVVSWLDVAKLGWRLGVE